MILTGYVRYLASGLWDITEPSPTRLLCANRASPRMYLEITKHETGYVDVSIPLDRGRYKASFGSEMHAYEYIENYMADDEDDVLRAQTPVPALNEESAAFQGGRKRRRTTTICVASNKWKYVRRSKQ